MGCKFSKPWSTEEEALLREFYPEHGPSWQGWEGILPGRGKRAISRKASTMGVLKTTRNNQWTSEELRILADNYAGRGYMWDGWKELLPNRKPTAIRNKAGDLGLLVKKVGSSKLSEGQQRFVLKGILAMADAIGTSPLAVSEEVIRLKELYENGEIQ